MGRSLTLLLNMTEACKTFSDQETAGLTKQKETTFDEHIDALPASQKLQRKCLLETYLDRCEPKGMSTRPKRIRKETKENEIF